MRITRSVKGGYANYEKHRGNKTVSTGYLIIPAYHNRRPAITGTAKMGIELDVAANIPTTTTNR
jgi:hypothetical protein